jgi:hypothetical protein
VGRAAEETAKTGAALRRNVHEPNENHAHPPRGKAGPGRRERNRSEKQYLFFKSLYDEETERTKQLYEHAKNYLSLAAFYSAFIVFAIQHLKPSAGRPGPAKQHGAKYKEGLIYKQAAAGEALRAHVVR